MRVEEERRWENGVIKREQKKKELYIFHVYILTLTNSVMVIYTQLFKELS